MDILIREATIDDAPEIVRLICELAESAGETCPLTEAYVREYFNSTGHWILLAEQDHAVTGLLSFSLRPDLFHAAPSGLIEELIVHRTQRSGGVGSELIKEALHRMKVLGCAEASVTTMQDNTEAIRFYKRHGMRDEALYLEKHF